MMATMKDVAQLAGVSTATVSRALMNPEKVSSLTRKRVEDAVLETGYSPNALTRNLRRNESKTIVVMIPNITDPYFNDIIRGVEDTASDNGYVVLLCDNSQSQSNSAAMSQFLTKQADGILLLGSDIHIDTSKSDQKALPPMAMACEYSPELELPTVHIDNLTSAFEAVNYLTRMGHTRIAQISGPKDAALCQFRHQGYQQALRRAGISLNERHCISGDYSFESGSQAVRTLMRQPDAPTAIFCHNDVMAIGAMQELKKLGLQVPKDVSLIGFDDITFSAFCDPPLTTMSQPRYEMGCQAMQILLSSLRGEEVANGSRLLDTNLVVRASVAPPKI
ncbi:DNA-binding transcriptional regulator CytR [Vibrio sp.]|nr:DNA-binding transcriptional regulator CytR [Vibrio sp.]